MVADLGIGTKLARVRLAAVAAAALIASGCGGSASVEEIADAAEPAASADVAPAPTPTAEPGSTSPEADRQPQRFVPGPRVGSAEAYDELIAELEQVVPAELRSSVPWPDLRHPDPAIAQQQIFDMWIWMAANHPDPVLIDVIAAFGGPTREHVAGYFGGLFFDDLRSVRPDEPYRAFDHEVFTLESADLPRWLTADVPDPDRAVVVWYSDHSGPVEVRDGTTGALIERQPAVPTRDWISIIVETDVGWLLWRDELLDASNSDLEAPEFEVPSPDATTPRTDL